MKRAILILSFCGFATTASAQINDSIAKASKLTMTFVQDTIVLKDDEIAFDILFNNEANYNISLFFADDLCGKVTEDSLKFSSGFAVLINRNTNQLFCEYIPRTRKQRNPSDVIMLRKFARRERRIKNGQSFCNKRKITIKPGFTTRQYYLSNFCRELPAGQYEISLIYRYSRDTPIDCSCVKCYPKIYHGEKFYEGKIVTDKLILIKH
jgi:hypothetical protein